MASSRIFVRGLPPTLTEEEFKKHFSSKYPTTDVKLFQNRRIGYVGFKTADDAAKAVKYFNRTFMRMSRIYVEIARPIAEVQPKSYRNQDRGARAGALPKPTPHAESTEENTLKRKRSEKEPSPSNPKLQEYLEVMKAPSKTKTGLGNPIVPDTSEPLVVPEALKGDESDDEYQEVRKKVKTDVKSKDQLTQVAQDSSPMEGIQQHRPETPPPIEGKSHVDEVVTAQPSTGPVSDSDWLRSRTSRLLDLENEDEQDKHAAKGDEQDGDSSRSKDVPARQVESVVESQEPPNVEPEISVQAPTESDQSLSSGRLFVRNLPFDVAERDLKELFGQHGNVEEVHVPVDSAKGSGKGFAYVEFTEPADAKAALESVDGSIFQGRLVHVIPAAPKRTQKLDDYEISKLPLKKQKLMKKKAEAGKSTFNWNSLYMNADAIMSSVADRLGVSKSDLLDPTSSDAAVKQAHAETHVIAETKAYFAQHSVDLDAFKNRERGDTAILVKNFAYGTKAEELRKLFEDFGTVRRFLMPPAGTIAIVEFAQAPEARAAFASLAYRKFKDSILFLEKAPVDLFKAAPDANPAVPQPVSGSGKEAQLSATDLLQSTDEPESVETATLFVRNLNFKTTTESLTDTFKPLDGFKSAVVRTKPDPKDPSKRLSMGFGFVEFRSKNQAQAALAAMQGYDLDGYKLLIKASHKGHDAAEERRREDKAKKESAKRTKIIVKNLPFEATKKDIRSLFGAYGQLRSVRVPKKFDRSARGFAFADFVSAREAENAMDALRNTHLLGRKLVLDFAANEPEDAEEELEKMQQKVGSQINKVALHKLTAPGRKKFNTNTEDQDQD